jgi:hypothetical protein
LNVKLSAAACGLVAAWIFHGSVHAQSWNTYDNYNTVTIPFTNGAMTASNPGQIYLQVGNGSPTKFTMDTGSTGITATPDNYTPGPNDQNLGPGPAHLQQQRHHRERHLLADQRQHPERRGQYGGDGAGEGPAGHQHHLPDRCP